MIILCSILSKVISLCAEKYSVEEPEACDVVVEHLCALLLLQQVGGKQPQLHDHTRETSRDLPLQEKETALRRNGQPGTRECGYLGI